MAEPVSDAHVHAEYDTNLERKISKALHAADVLLLVGMAFAGLYFGVRDVVHPHEEDLTRLVSIALSLLGFLSLHFALQRAGILRQLLVLATHIDEVTFKISQHTDAARVTRLLIRIQELWMALREVNPAFADVSRRVLFEQEAMVEQMVHAVIDVPESYIRTTSSAMLEAYKGTRFDAVSFEDLVFWSDRRESAQAYFKRNVDAITQEDTVVTRLFIFPEHDLVANRDRVVDILDRHRINGIAWALVISAEAQARVNEEPLDFALFNGGKAVSFFRHEGGRRFIVRFATDGRIRENDSVVARQQRVYTKLLHEVWLATDNFASNYLGSGDADFRQKFERVMKTRTDILRNRAAGITGSIFPFVVKPTDALDSNLQSCVAAFRAQQP